MRFIQAMLLGLATLAMLAMIPGGDARAQSSDAYYVVTYIEVLPSSRSQASSMLSEYSDAIQRQDGNLRFDVLQRIDRPSHFAIVEAWKDQKAFDAHSAAPVTKRMRDSLAPHLSAGYDERPHGAMAVGDIKANTSRRMVFAVTHVDFIPPKKDDGIAAAKALAEATRKNEKPVRFEVLQQGSRPNHLTFVEVWPNQKALEAHWASEATRKFRNETLPMSGALYDERLYRMLK
jgi:quinol monooxygenase YgiN